MPQTLPMPHTSDMIASNPVTSKDGEWQYAALYTCDAGARVFVFRKHYLLQWSQADVTSISGAALTALDLPVDDDGHNFISLGLSYNLDGTVRRVYLWANMHNGVGPTGGNLKMIRTTTTNGTIATWEATTLPGTINECTYPVAISLANGDLWYTMRDGGISGDGDYYQWFLPAGSDTWSAKSILFAGMGSATGGESAYCYFHVRPNGDVLCCGNWRTATFDDFANDGLFFMLSRDNARTWKTIDGTSIPTPITYANTQAIPNCEVGLTLTGGEAAFLNGGGVCWGPNNAPVIVYSLNPMYYITWNGSAWVQTQLGGTGGLNLEGVRLSTRIVPIFYKKRLAYLAVGWELASRWRRFPYIFIMDSPTVCVQAIRIGTQVSFGEVNNDAGQHWEFIHDRDAYRQGKISVWTPSGNTPYTWDSPNYAALAFA